ncbi:MAG TPA: DUF2934 domain-containing protein [Bryobacteraceae bacterium]
MSWAEIGSSTKREARRAYQQAFHDFSECVRRLQSVINDPHPDRAAIEAALLEVEKTRVVYDSRRDALARHLLPLNPGILPTTDSQEAVAEHVKDIAEILWEAAGKPDGTAADDWRRAEEIVKSAVAAA